MGCGSAPRSRGALAAARADAWRGGLRGGAPAGRRDACRLIDAAGAGDRGRARRYRERRGERSDRCAVAERLRALRRAGDRRMLGHRRRHAARRAWWRRTGTRRYRSRRNWCCSCISGRMVSSRRSSPPMARCAGSGCNRHGLGLRQQRPDAGDHRAGHAQPDRPAADPAGAIGGRRAGLAADAAAHGGPLVPAGRCRRRGRRRGSRRAHRRPHQSARAALCCTPTTRSIGEIARRRIGSGAPGDLSVEPPPLRRAATQAAGAAGCRRHRGAAGRRGGLSGFDFEGGLAGRALRHAFLGHL